MSLKSMTIAELEQRKRACKAFGVDSSAVDQELRSRPNRGEYELKGLTTAELQQRRQMAVERDFKAALGAIDSELARRNVQPRQPEHRRQRKILMPGSTSGSFVVRYIDED